jgi:membrane protein DedA with SNARE-associated domain
MAFVYELLGWFGWMASAGFGNPTPEELSFVASGLRAGANPDDLGPWWLLLLPAVLAGALLADVVLYLFGRLLGGSWVMRWLAPPEKRERIRENFHHYGFWIFLFGRLVPGIRTTLFLSAGMMKLSFGRFLLVDAVGGIFGGSLFFFLGYGVSKGFVDEQNLRRLEKVEGWVLQNRTWVIIALAVVVGGYLLYRFLRHPIQTGDPDEVPLIGSKIVKVLPVPKPEHAATPPAEAPKEAPAAPPVAAPPGGVQQTPHQTA